MTVRKTHGFTLVEILIVVVIMAVLAATIIPQFTDSAQDAKANTALFNLHTMRSQIEMYKSQHDGNPPSPLTRLTEKTNRDGGLTGGAVVYGPYIHEIPANPLVDSAFDDVVAATTGTSTTLPTVADDAGWLYNATTGDIFINHIDYLNE